MYKRHIFQGILSMIFIAGFVLSCQKKGNYIDEGKTGTGMHYYPVILNDGYYDTISKQNIQGATLSQGQQVIFQLLYRSKDKLNHLELWAAKEDENPQKVWETAYSSSFYSEKQQCDSTFINYRVPESDTAFSSVSLYLKIATDIGLEMQQQINFLVR